MLEKKCFKIFIQLICGRSFLTFPLVLFLIGWGNALSSQNNSVGLENSGNVKDSSIGLLENHTLFLGFDHPVVEDGELRVIFLGYQNRVHQLVSLRSSFNYVPPEFYLRRRRRGTNKGVRFLHGSYFAFGGDFLPINGKYELGLGLDILFQRRAPYHRNYEFLQFGVGGTLINRFHFLEHTVLEIEMIGLSIMRQIGIDNSFPDKSFFNDGIGFYRTISLSVGYKFN